MNEAQLFYITTAESKTHGKVVLFFKRMKCGHLEIVIKKFPPKIQVEEPFHGC